MRILAPHATEEKKLAKVVKQMKKLGCPTIRVREICGEIVAVEGSHRLAAAKILRYTPILDYTSDILDTELNTEWAQADSEAEFIDKLSATMADMVAVE